MSFNSFEETEESHKEAPAGITGYPERLPAIKPFSPSQVANTCAYRDQVQRPPTEHDFRYEGHLESKERFAIKKYLLIIGKK